MKKSIKSLLAVGMLSVFAVFSLGCEVGTGTQSYSGDGFALEYPGTWIYESADNIVLFSGAEGTEAYDATVNVQTMVSGEFYNELSDVYDDYRAQVEGVNGTVTEMTETDFVQDGESYPSIEFSAEYEDGVEFRQHISVIDRGDGFFQQISYTAPAHIYNRYESEAMAIVESFELSL